MKCLIEGQNLESFQDFFDQVGPETKYASSGNKLISTRYICGFMSNSIKKYLKDSRLDDSCCDSKMKFNDMRQNFLQAHKTNL